MFRWLFFRRPGTTDPEAQAREFRRIKDAQNFSRRTNL